MSFSSETKNEICSISYGKHRVISAELSALFHMCGSISFKGKNKVKFTVKTENAAVARRVFSLIKQNYQINARVLVTKNVQLNNKNMYSVIIPYEYKPLDVLLDLGIVRLSNGVYSLINKIPQEYAEDSECIKATIRGAFLGGGSISNPEKSYHLEFICHNSEYAVQLRDLINLYDLNAKLIKRKSNYVVYIKEIEKIITILNVMGAHRTLLNIENIRILKEMRNNVNRLVNCETANLNKTVEASYKQIKAIEYIDEKIGIESLPQKLREVAELRLNNKDASLKELGEMLTPPVGKSGVNHRLKKIVYTAQSMGLEID